MSFFDPEVMFRKLVSAMGLEPDQIRAFVIEVITKVRVIDADRVAFKGAVQKTVPELLAQMSRMEAKLDLLLAKQGVTNGMAIAVEDGQMYIKGIENGRHSNGPASGPDPLGSGGE